MEKLKAVAPGLALSIGLAACAYFLAETPVFKSQLHIGALLLVILAGMLVRSFVRLPESLQPGIAFAQKPLLRAAVALLGFKLSLQEIANIGGPALAIVVGCTFVALVTGYWFCRLFGLDEKLSILTGVGGAICGASAIVAADSVVQSEKSETASALGTITLLGTIGIALYPPIGHALGLTDLQYSIWNGASLHEMAQVVAAGHSFSPDAEKISTVVKLVRITLLAPTVLYIAWEARRRWGASGENKTPIAPWFLALFVVFAAVNSFAKFTPEIKSAISLISLWTLCIGMAGVGLNSGFQDVRAHGIRPVIAGALQWIALAGLSLALAMQVK